MSNEEHGFSDITTKATEWLKVKRELKTLGTEVCSVRKKLKTVEAELVKMMAVKHMESVDVNGKTVSRNQGLASKDA